MRRFLLLTVLCASVAGLSAPPAGAQTPGPLLKYPGMKLGGSITRDSYGIASVWALDAWDLFYLQGYVHATDRLFQMDTTRRQPSGTLAELLGSAALSSSGAMQPARTLPSSTPHWSNGSNCQITACVKTLCS